MAIQKTLMTLAVAAFETVEAAECFKFGATKEQGYYCDLKQVDPADSLKFPALTAGVDSCTYGSSLAQNWNGKCSMGELQPKKKIVDARTGSSGPETVQMANIISHCCSSGKAGTTTSRSIKLDGNDISIMGMDPITFYIVMIVLPCLLLFVGIILCCCYGCCKCYGGAAKAIVKEAAKGANAATKKAEP